MARRILIECTPTYTTNMSTGIQRVVRNLVHYTCSDTERQTQVIPVIFQASELFPIPHESLFPPDSSGAENRNFSARLTSFLLGLNNKPLIIYIKDKLRVSFYPFYTFIKRLLALIIVRLKIRKIKSSAIIPGDQDIVVFADVFWGRNHWNDVERLRSKGSRIVFILYDLIPITCQKIYGTPQVTEEFRNYLDKVLANSDQVLCISESVRQDLERYISDNIDVKKTALPQIDFFYLGSNIAEDENQAIQPALFRVFENEGIPVFIYVSTIEPRKNHGYLLDSFDILWRKGIKARLLIAGRVGWLSEHLLKRIENHAQFNKNLFMFHELSDTEIGFCYQNARALVFPSLDEGFGLPVIEALQNGLPVIASDIPVLREIGKDMLMYIDPYDSLTLVSRISQIADTGIEAQYIPKDFHWLSWQESSEQFLDKVLGGTS